MRSLAFVLFALLAACSPGEKTRVVFDGVLDRSLSADPETLDPQLARSVAAAKVLGDLYEPLFVLDAAGRAVEGLARDWQVSDDGLTWTFELREAARWSDGTPVVAADVVRGLRYLADPANGAFYAGSLGVVRNAGGIARAELPAEALGVEATSPSVVTITLERPAAQLPDILAHSSTAPRHESAGSLTPEQGRPVNGPYRLVRRQFSGAIDLERNPHFHSVDDVAIDAVRYLPIEDEMAELQRFRAGGLDITSRIPAAMLDRVDPATVRLAPYLGVYYLAFNLRLPPFAGEPDLRHAIALAIDPALITETITRRGELPAYGWVPPGIDGYPALAVDAALTTAELRLERAREHLAAAGIDPNDPPAVTLRYNTSEENRRIVVAIQEQVRAALGIEIELLAQEFKVLIATTRSGLEPGMARGSWIGDYADPANFLGIFATGHSSNPSGYSNPEFDSLLQRAAASTDRMRRYELLQDAERLLMQDLPVVPVYFYVSKHLVQPYVQGFADNPLDYHYSRWLSIAGLTPD